jgi:hypothetical protein
LRQRNILKIVYDVRPDNTSSIAWENDLIPKYSISVECDFLNGQYTFIWVYINCFLVNEYTKLKAWWKRVWLFWINQIVVNLMKTCKQLKSRQEGNHIKAGL